MSEEYQYSQALARITGRHTLARCGPRGRRCAPGHVRLARIEAEEFVRDENRGIDRLEQLEGAAKFLVATLRAAAEKEPTAHPLVRLVDSDVLAGHPRVPDEQCGRRQSTKSPPTMCALMGLQAVRRGPRRCVRLGGVAMAFVDTGAQVRSPRPQRRQRFRQREDLGGARLRNASAPPPSLPI